MAKKNFVKIKDLSSKDLIAAIFVIGGFILMAMKIDTIVGGLLTLIAGFYFGSKYGEKK